MTISKDRVKPSPMLGSWKLKKIFATGVVYGSYLDLMTTIFFSAMKETDFFSVCILYPAISCLRVPVKSTYRLAQQRPASHT
ncbi:uncharacterized protein M6B38_337220 [Iris pallida]|uniref:Uncharacterized protein n=1 Tax=Iris pallida TaxID=29817 RepID=A0AAX6GZL7_IRIPA|nr:uncharacterized protein M6B38_337220 [Iris pallida]